MNDLFAMSLAGTLLDIGRRKATGALQITVGGRLRLLFFEQGTLVYFVSNLPEENLAITLRRPGRLDSPADRLKLEQAERQVTHKRTLVSLLLEHALCGDAHLQVWLVQYAFECLGRAFDEPTGTVKMSEGVRANHPLPFSVPVATLILEAVRRMESEQTIRDAVGPLTFLVEPAPDHIARIESLPLAFYDGIVASQVTQRTTLEDLVAIIGLPELDVLRAILALRAVGVLDPFVPLTELSGTGRLRMRKAALDAGVPVDLGAVAAFKIATDHEVPWTGPAFAAPGPLTMGELEGTAPAQLLPDVARVPAHAPVGALRRRGNTAQLNLMAIAYRQMAEAEAASGNVGAAMQYYESALAQAPENLDLLTGFAGLLAGRPGGQGAAEKLLEKACVAHPNSPVPRLLLAKMYRAMGRPAQAEEMRAEADRLTPGGAAEGRGRKGDRSDGSSGRGFFARLRDRNDAPPRAAQQPTPAARQQVLPATGDGPHPEAGRKCRHCGVACPLRAPVCRRCGATL